VTTREDERVMEQILAPLGSVPPARRRQRRRAPSRVLGVALLLTLVAVFVAVQPRGASHSVEGRAVAPPAPTPTLGQLAARFARSMVGRPFRWGGSAPTGFDTSGLVVWSFGQAGRPGLPHSTGALWRAGPHVPPDRLQAGDIVFFDGLTQVGVYLGGGLFVHASPPRVKVVSFAGGWDKRLDGAVRVPPHVVDNEILDVRWAARSRTGMLERGRVNVVPGTDRPRYVIRVANLGETWQTGLRVRLIVPLQPARQAILSALAPGAVRSVSIIAPTPLFQKPFAFRFEVVPARNETVVTNNAATYRVQYELQ
jgi:cell wall-associated NlpC family hydrolase